MRQYYSSSVKADLREEPACYVVSIDGVDVVKANVVKMSEYGGRAEREILESKYSKCNPWPQVPLDDMPKSAPSHPGQLLYMRQHYRAALREGMGVNVALMHQRIKPKIPDKEIQSWECEVCGSLVDASNGFGCTE